MASLPPNEEWLNREQTEEYLSLSAWGLRQLHNRNVGPKYIKNGQRHWYAKSTLDSWLSAQRDPAYAATRHLLRATGNPFEDLHAPTERERRPLESSKRQELAFKIVEHAALISAWARELALTR